MNENWTIRDALPDDLSFIYATWARSYRYDSPLGKQCDTSVFVPEYHKVIDSILSQYDCRVIVASKPKDSKIIFGYLVAEPGILHYIFVKQAFCGQGIAKSLYKKANEPKIYTHETIFASKILKKHGSNLIYNPFLLFKQETIDG